MRTESKIFIILVSISFLGVVGYVVGMNIEDEKYPINELVLKYPLISDLKRAVVSGELDYDRLPVGAKEALDKYDSFEKDDTRIIKELSP